MAQVPVAVTPRDVCSIKLGEDPGKLRRLLDEEFSEAELIEEPAALKPFREAILSFLAGDQSLASVPLDVRGTVFQRKVWEQLGRIPAGETRTYQEIARAIGPPAAVPAVC